MMKLSGDVFIFILLPRFILFVMWLLTNWLSTAFEAYWMIPVFGFVFLPYTTLVFVAAMIIGQQFTIFWAIVFTAVFLVELVGQLITSLTH